MNDRQRPLVSSGTLIGIGMGGFADGILFHQVLQLHSMLTGRIAKDTIANIEINMFWDGMFHTLTWCATAFGIWCLFRAAQRTDPFFSTKTFVGSLALGWGLFNFIEGLINHHILHLHHVVEVFGLSVFDWAFLASGVMLITIGWFVIQADAQSPPSRVANVHKVRRNGARPVTLAFTRRA